MRYDSVTRENAVMLAPETVNEAGLFQWLAKRFEGKAVTLVFDTTDTISTPHMPMLWVKPQEADAILKSEDSGKEDGNG